MAVKSRNTSDLVLLGTEYLQGSAPTPVYTSTNRHQDNMFGGAEGHYGYPDFPPDKAVGGDFILNSWRFNSPVLPVGEVWRQGGPLAQYYTGALSPKGGTIGKVGGNLATISSSMGSDAYNRMKPTKPDFSAANAIYELRELPSQFRQRFLKDGLYAIPNYWLALQFGWKPLLADIRNFVLTQMSAQKRIKQLLRDNGRPVRRRVTLFDNTISESIFASTAYQVMTPGFVTQYYPKPGLSVLRTRDYDKGWASARFRYWLPDGPRDINWRRAMLFRIMGGLPSPSVVWNALPWTWLVDWFVDVGTMLENMDAGVANRLAADYFYVMRSRGGIQTNECTQWLFRKTGEVFSVNGTSVTEWSHKTRSPGDPFGWNTAENNLSGMQLSIIGALGLSRLR